MLQDLDQKDAVDGSLELGASLEKLHVREDLHRARLHVAAGDVAPGVRAHRRRPVHCQDSRRVALAQALGDPSDAAAVVDHQVSVAHQSEPVDRVQGRFRGQLPVVVPEDHRPGLAQARIIELDPVVQPSPIRDREADEVEALLDSSQRSADGGRQQSPGGVASGGAQAHAGRVVGSRLAPLPETDAIPPSR